MTSCHITYGGGGSGLFEPLSLHSAYLMTHLLSDRVEGIDIHGSAQQALVEDEDKGQPEGRQEEVDGSNKEENKIHHLPTIQGQSTENEVHHLPTIQYTKYNNFRVSDWQDV